jgi:tetratricopeptide (TPR) repeat protein
MATPRLPTPPGPVPVSHATHGEDPVIPGEIGGDAAEALGLLLECVSAWVSRAVEGRGLGYHPAADRVRTDAVAELLLTCEALLRLVHEDRPDPDTSEAVGLGCFQIAEWAEERGALGTALAWAQTAIAAWPQQPHYAYLIGRLARKRAQNAHAEDWLRYAMRLARRRMVWEVYALALSGYANLKRQKGNIPVATRYHRLALKAARRFGLKTFEGDAFYDLAVMCFEVGEARTGVDYSRKALAAYGPGHTRVAQLASDVAWCLMCHFGEFEQAAYVFESLLAHVWEPAPRLLVCANLARAAAGAGWEEAFEKAWVNTWILLGAPGSQEAHASALLQLAHGAASVGAWERAKMAIDQAISVSRAREEHKVLAMSEAIRAALVGESAAAGFLSPRFSADETLGGEADDLAGEFVRAMRVRRDGAPESPLRMLIEGR